MKDSKEDEDDEDQRNEDIDIDVDIDGEAIENSDTNNTSSSRTKRINNSKTELGEGISTTQSSDLMENSMRLMVLERVEQASSNRLKRKRRRKVRKIENSSATSCARISKYPITIDSILNIK